jgi:hypothetical protein
LYCIILGEEIFVAACQKKICAIGGFVFPSSNRIPAIIQYWRRNYASIKLLR